MNIIIKGYTNPFAGSILSREHHPDHYIICIRWSESRKYGV